MSERIQWSELTPGQMRETILREFDKILLPLYLEVDASIAEDLHVKIAEKVMQILEDQNQK